MPRNRFDQIIDAWEPRLKAAFLKAVADIRGAAQIKVIAERLERGDIEGALQAVGVDPVRFRGYDAAMQQAFLAGGDDTAGKVPRIRQPDGSRLEVLFDIRNPNAETWLRGRSSRRISEIVADQRAMIREHLRAGMEAGKNPRAVALDLVGRVDSTTKRRTGGAIGLTASQEQWVRNYRAALSNPGTMQEALSRTLRDKRFDRAVTAAIKSGKPLTVEQIDAMVRNYRNRALRYRAETIARTEAMAALHQGSTEGMRQAIADGKIDAAIVTKTWHTAGDDRVRHSHRAMSGQQVGFYESFTAPSGARLEYPGDPNAPAEEIINCRCWMEIGADFLAGVR